MTNVVLIVRFQYLNKLDGSYEIWLDVCFEVFEDHPPHDLGTRVARANGRDSTDSERGALAHTMINNGPLST